MIRKAHSTTSLLVTSPAPPNLIFILTGESLKYNISYLSQYKKLLTAVLLKIFLLHFKIWLDFTLDKTPNCLKGSKSEPSWLNSHEGLETDEDRMDLQTCSEGLIGFCFMPNVEECCKYWTQWLDWEPSILGNFRNILSSFLSPEIPITWVIKKKSGTLRFMC